MKDCNSSRVCLICGKSYIKLGNHIKQTHSLSQQQYYDTYLKKECDGVCKICGSVTSFIRLHEGYRQYCSKACMYADIDRTKKIAQTCMKRYGVSNAFQTTRNAFTDSANIKRVNSMIVTNLQKYGTKTVLTDKDIQQKARQNSHTDSANLKRRSTYTNRILEFEVLYDCTSITKLVKQFGQNFLKLKPELNLIYNGSNTYVSNSDLDKISRYNEIVEYKESCQERELYNYIRSIYDGKIIQRSRSVITPLELDIYIPDCKIVIEFNGTYWHSEFYKDKLYHYNKSIKCLYQHIKLIHIYDVDWLNASTKAKIKQYLKVELSEPCNLYNTIRFIDKHTAMSFISQYSLTKISTTDSELIYIGTYIESELVQVLVLHHNNIINYTRSLKISYDFYDIVQFIFENTNYNNLVYKANFDILSFDITNISLLKYKYTILEPTIVHTYKQYNVYNSGVFEWIIEKE